MNERNRRQAQSQQKQAVGNQPRFSIPLDHPSDPSLRQRADNSAISDQIPAQFHILVIGAVEVEVFADQQAKSHFKRGEAECGQEKDGD